MNRADVSTWLEAYVRAWKTYDPGSIADLFTEDATYAFSPYRSPIRGRAAIVMSWLENPDTPGTYSGDYTPVTIEGNLAVANGRTRYFEADGTTLKTEFDNIFILRFDDEGRCAEYREWWMERPKNAAS